MKSGHPSLVGEIGIHCGFKIRRLTIGACRFESGPRDQQLGVAMRYVFGTVLTLLVLLSSAACGKIDNTVAAWTGNATKICVDGVTYLQFTSGAAVQLDRSGKPVPCN